MIMQHKISDMELYIKGRTDCPDMEKIFTLIQDVNKLQRNFHLAFERVKYLV